VSKKRLRLRLFFFRVVILEFALPKMWCQFFSAIGVTARALLKLKLRSQRTARLCLRLSTEGLSYAMLSGFDCAVGYHTRRAENTSWSEQRRSSGRTLYSCQWKGQTSANNQQWPPLVCRHECYWLNLCM
jgi:hypothetical protein